MGLLFFMLTACSHRQPSACNWRRPKIRGQPTDDLRLIGRDTRILAGTFAYAIQKVLNYRGRGVGTRVAGGGLDRKVEVRPVSLTERTGRDRLMWGGWPDVYSYQCKECCG